MKISILNGPKLNLLGTREPEIYGTKTLDEIINGLSSAFPRIGFHVFQTDNEEELADAVTEAGREADGIILNAAAFTHTSVAVGEAVASCPVPVVEVHISNIFAREDFRHVSMVGRYCSGTIAGFGSDSYRLAVEALVKISAR